MPFHWNVFIPLFRLFVVMIFLISTLLQNKVYSEDSDKFKDLLERGIQSLNLACEDVKQKNFCFIKNFLFSLSKKYKFFMVWLFTLSKQMVLGNNSLRRFLILFID